MKPTKRVPEIVITGAVAALIALPAYADFDKRIYVGIGGGVSFIEPDPSANNTDYENDDTSDTGGKVYLGWDFAEHWGVEGFYADLGEATLKARSGQMPEPLTGSVAYEVPGLSLLYRLYNSRGSVGRMERNGLDLFLKAGVAKLDTSSDDGLEIKQLEDIQYNLGVGAEYGLGRHLAARADVEFFDKDARLATVGLLWRFGGGDMGASATIPAVAAVGATTSETAPTASASKADPLDSDLDGVADALDTCGATSPGVAVNSRGCPLFDGPIAGVNFHSGSGDLTPEAMTVLDGVAEELSRSPNVRVAVMAHTDNTGSAASNLELSKKRAVSVAKYLVSKGVSAQQIRPEAYGESRPAVSNATSEGRRQNRRIELRTLN